MLQLPPLRRFVSLACFIIAAAYADARAACFYTLDVGAGQTYTTIQAAINAIPASLAGEACVVLKDAGPFAELVSVSAKTNNGYRISIAKDAALGSTPVINPAGGTGAVFAIRNASVTLENIEIAPTASIAYGVDASSQFVHLTSVTVLGGGNITTAGIYISSSQPVITYSSANSDGGYGIHFAVNSNWAELRFSSATSGTSKALYVESDDVFVSSTVAESSTTANARGIEIAATAERTKVYYSTAQVYGSADLSSIAFQIRGDSTTVKSSVARHHSSGGNPTAFREESSASYSVFENLLVEGSWETGLFFGNGTAVRDSVFRKSAGRTCWLGGTNQSMERSICEGAGYNFFVNGTNATVRRSTFTGANWYFWGASSLTIRDSYVEQMRDINAGSNFLIEDSTIVGRGGAAAFQLADDTWTFRRCFIWSDSGTPAYAQSGSYGGLIEDSTITTNSGSYGAQVDGTSVTIRRSYIQGNAGVYGNAVTRVTLEDNTIVAVAGNGNALRLLNGTNATVRGNRLRIPAGNGSGIYLDQVTGGVFDISTNTIESVGGQYGIRVTTTSATVWIASNTVLPPLSTANNTYGIALTGLTGLVRVTNNSVVLRSSGSASGRTAFGLFAQSFSGLTADHNRISNPGLISAGSFEAIRLDGAANATLKFNDLHSTGSFTNAQLLRLETSATGATVKNNVFSASFTVTGASATVSVSANSQTGFSSDFNDFFSSNSLNAAIWGGTGCALPNWTGGGCPGQDANSIAGHPRWTRTEAPAEDFHPRSSIGRYDPATQGFVTTDSLISPLVDAGDPGESYANETQPDGNRVDQGSYGNTAEASRSPEAPTSATIAAVYNSSVTVSYGTTSAPKYLVEASTASNFSGTVSSSETTNAAVAALTPQNLYPNTTYYLRAGALWGITTYYTNASPASTASLANAPASLQVYSVFSTSVTVNWKAFPTAAQDASSMTAEGYRLEASTAANFSGAVFSSATTNMALSTLTVSALGSGSTYYFRVASLNWGGAPHYGIDGSTRTTGNTPPYEPLVAAVYGGSVTVSYVTVGAGGYVVEAATAADFTGSLWVSSATANPNLGALTPASLNPNTTYYLRAGAIYGQTTSYALATPISTSSLANPPQSIQVYQVNYTSVTVNWKSLPTAAAEGSSSTAEGYLLQASTAADFSGTVWSSATFNGVQPSTLTVSGLLRYTTYYFRVGSLNWNGVARFAVSGSTFTRATEGCWVEYPVGPSQAITTIQAGVNAIPSPLAGDACVALMETGPYAETVTVSAKANNGYRIRILADSALGAQPRVAPAGGTGAVFDIRNASVTLENIEIAPTASIPYGVDGSSQFLHLTSVTVSGGDNIAAAGIRISSVQAIVRYSSANATNGYGLHLALNSHWSEVWFSSWTSGNNKAFYIESDGVFVSSTIAESSTTANARGLEIASTAERTKVYYSTAQVYGSADLSSIAFQIRGDSTTVKSSVARHHSSGGNPTAFREESSASASVFESLLVEGSWETGLFFGNGTKIRDSVFRKSSGRTCWLGGTNQSMERSICQGAAYNMFVTATNATVRRSTFTGANWYFWVTSSITVRDSYIEQMADINQGSNYLIEDSTIASASGNAFALQDDTWTFRRCFIQSASGIAAIAQTNSYGGLIEDSTITTNSGSYGFQVQGTSLTIRRSYVQGNTGAYFNAATRPRLEDNTIVGRTGNGHALHVYRGAGGVTVAGNRLRAPTGSGSALYLEQVNGGVFDISTNTVLAGGGLYGIRATNLAASTLWIASNTVSPPLSTAGDTYGIHLNGLTGGATLHNNSIVLRATGSASGQTAFGLYAQGFSGLVVDHNRFSNPGLIGAGSFTAVQFDGATNASFKYNDLHSTGSFTSAYLLRLENTATGAKVNHNVFSTSFSVTGTSATVSVSANSQTDFVSNYNNYYSSNAFNTALWGALPCALPGWAGASCPAQDANSIAAAPYWANTEAPNEDFHPRSLGGRWDPASQAFVLTDSVSAATIDAGLSTEAYGNETAPNGSRVNLGSYGNTAEASRSSAKWTSAWNSAETEGAWSVAWGDYDNDGDLDLALGNYPNATNRVYRNDGAMSFAAAWNSAEAESTTGVAWGDYDNDGDLDLAAANDAQTNRIYRNAGAGTLASAWNSAETEASYWVAWGDYNNDGLLDMAVANAGATDNVRVYRHTGNGAFGLGWTWASGGVDVNGVAWGDYDNDGDLGVGAATAGTNRVLTEGGVSFWNSAETENSAGVSWGDYDADGDLDMLIANGGAVTDRVYRNAGASFSSEWNSPEAENTWKSAWGDYDNDGDLDFAVANYASTTDRVYRNNAGASFLSIWNTPESDSTNEVAWGDADGDGILDLAQGNGSALTKRIYQGANIVANSAPSAPSGLTAFFTYGVGKSTLTFRWAAGDYDSNGVTETVHYALAAATAPMTVAFDNLRITYPSSNTVAGATFTFAWTQGSPLLGHYLRPKYDGSLDKHEVLLATQANTTAKALRLNTTYFFRVQAVDAGLRRGAWSAEFATATLSAPVTDAQIYAVHLTSVTLNWKEHPASPQEQSARGYRLEASTASDFSGTVFLSSNSNIAVSTLTLTGLGQGNTYYFRVGSLNWGNAANYLSLGSTRTSALWLSAWNSAETESTYGVAWGDYDNDGDLDLAVANGSNQTDRVYRNNGGGSFASAWNSAEADTTISVAWGDYDNDGDLDLAAGGQTKRIYRNDGGGSFASAWNSAESEDTYGVVWGDYDNDGDLDLAAGNASNQTNRIYRNDGSGFASAWNSAETEYTLGVAWADYDNDGDLDLGAGNYGQTNRIYRNAGGGAFAGAWNSAETEWTYDVVWSDYDDDGDLDLAVGNSGGTNRIYRNDGGGFASAWNSAETEDSRGVAWGDYDNDGDLDLAVGNYANQTNRIYRNAGDGTLASAWNSLETESTYGVAWGDYDNDGDLDLAVGNSGQTNRVYGGQNLGVNAAPSAPSGLVAAFAYGTDKSTLTFRWSAGDYDANGVTESVHYAITAATGPISVSFDGLRVTFPSPSSVADATFSFSWTQGSPLLGHYLRPRYDGALDKHEVILATQANTSAKALRLNTTYFFRVQAVDAGLRRSLWSAQTASATLATPVTDAQIYSVFYTSVTLNWKALPASPQEQSARGYRLEASTAANFSGTITLSSNNAVGTSTLTVVGLGQGNTYYFRVGSLNWANAPNYISAGSTRTSAFWVSAWNSAEAETTYAVAWGDYDNDGDLDLAAGNNGQTKRVYGNDGAGSLSSAWNSAQTGGTGFGGVAWGDYDNDGDLDLAIGNAGGGTDYVYRNGGAGSLAAAWNSAESESTYGVAWGDYDNDGDLDLAAANYTLTNRVYRNDGPASLASAWNSLETESSQAVAWGDFDNDGDLDLAFGNEAETNRVYRNEGGSAFSSAWNSVETEWTKSMPWGDYDNDGDLDLAAGNAASTTDRVYRNSGSGFASAWNSVETETTMSVAWADYDGDGDLDLLAGNYTQTSRVYRNDAGSFESAWNSSLAEGTFGAAWGDYDNDGRPDFALGNVTNATNRVYRGIDIPANAAPSAPSGLSAVFAYGADKSTLAFRWSAGDYDANGVTETVHYAIVAATAPMTLAGDNLRVTYPSSNTVAGATFAFSWTQGSPLLGHYLRPRYDGALDRHEVLLATQANTAARPLKLNTTYYFRVQAVDAGLRRGPWSTEFATATLASPPQNAQLQSVTLGSVTVNWTPHPASPREESALGYRLEASTASDFSGTLFLSSNSGVSVSTLAISGLAEYTTYYFRVGSLNWASVPSYAAAFSTRTRSSCYEVGAGHAYATIQSGVNAIPSSLTEDVCVRIRDAGPYAETVTVSAKATNGWRITIKKDGALGSKPRVSPAGGAAAFEIKNASVTLENLEIAPTGAVSYGIDASSSWVRVSSVQVNGATTISAAGIRLSHLSTIEYSSVTVGAAHGIHLNGASLSTVAYSTAANSSASQYALYFNGASSNTVTVYFSSGATRLDGTSVGNYIERSTLATSGSLPAVQFIGSGQSSNTVRYGYIQNAGTAESLLIGSGATYNRVERSTAIMLGTSADAVNIQGSNSVLSEIYARSDNRRAVYFQNGTFSTIELSTVTSNYSGIGGSVHLAGSSNTISNCYVENTVGNGVTQYGSNHVISGSTIVGAGNPALYMCGGGGTFVTVKDSFIRNTSASNTGVEMCYSDFTLLRSTVTTAGGVGVWISGQRHKVESSYVQGSTAVSYGYQRDLAVFGSVLVATGTNNAALAMTGDSSNLSLTSSTLMPGVNGNGLFVGISAGGSVLVASNTLYGGLSAALIESTITATVFTISSNTILPRVASGFNRYGLQFKRNLLSPGATVYANSIYYRTPGTMGTNVAYAIWAQDFPGLVLDHNRISNPGMISAGSFEAIRLEGATNAVLKYNDVHSTGSFTDAFLLRIQNTATGAKVDHNAFSTSFSVTGTSATVDVSANSQTGFVANYNNYYSSNSRNSALWGAAPCTLPNWTGSGSCPAAGVQDSRSFAGPPHWASVAAPNEDFHPRATAGRWDPATQGFVTTDLISAASVDAGSTSSAYGYETSPNGSRVNLGSYGNTSEASRSSAKWSSAWNSAETEPTWSVAWGDYDNDGDLDLAVGNLNNTTNRVYRNDGGGSFVSAWNSAEAQDTRGIAWGDYDNDGDLDLAAVNYAQTNRIYRNDGAGALSSAWNSGETENTLGVAWGDYDADGDLDLAVGNYSSQSNRIYRNDGGSAFAAAWNSAEGEDTLAVAWGDYDSDGDLDLAAGNYTSQTDRVYRNNGGGAFASAWNSAELEDAYGIAWGDYDSDGDLDLAVANNNSQTNRVYRGDGAGGLSSGWNSVETESTAAVAWGDYDNDGDLDLAAGNLTQTNRVYRNNGGGSFGSAWNSVETETSYGIAWGDYDGDGVLDLAAGNDSGTNRVYQGIAIAANAAPSAPAGLAASFAYGVDRSTLTFRWSASDYDANGVTETVHYAIVAATGPISLAGDSLRVTYPSSNSVAGATFTFSWTQGSPLLGHYLRPKYDGSLDKHEVILATQANTTAKALRLNTTYYFRVQAVDAGLRRGAWSAESATATLAAPVTDAQVYAVHLTSVTLNWKEHPASPQEQSALGYRLEASTASNYSGTVYSSATANIALSTLTLAGLGQGATYYFRVGSLNWGNAANYISIGSTRTSALWLSAWNSAQTDSVWSVAWGDYDNDGDLDLAVGNYSNTTNRVYRNDGAMSFAAAWNSAEGQNTASVAWGDYDNDGDLDLAAGNDGQTSRVYRNDGAGGLASAWNSAETDATYEMAWGDYDNDGDLDLAAANYTSQSDRVYRNNGGASFASAWNSSEGESGTGVAWADYDNDGDLDFAVSNWIQTNRVYRNAGDGTFASAWNSAEAEYSGRAGWGDYDGDGDPDLVVSNANNQTDRVYRNAGGSFSSAWNSPEAETGWGAAWGDYDNDGDLDFAVANYASQSNRVYANAGGAFASSWNSLETENSNAIAWGDADGDGILDLAVGNGISQGDRVYRGQSMLPTNAAPSAPSGLVANFAYGADKSTLTFRWSAGDYDANGATEAVHYAIVAATGPIALAGDNLRVTYPSSNSVAGATFSFSWTQGSPLLGHYLRPRYDGALDKHEVILATQANTSAKALRLNTTYYFRVQAIDAGLRAGVWSAQTASATLAAPVTDAQIYRVYYTSATLNWKALPAAPQEQSARGYRLEASTAANFSGTIVLSSNNAVGTSTLTLVGLGQGNTYYFRVGSLNWASAPNYISAGSTRTSALWLSAWNSAESENSRSVAWGDYDNDGDLDLACGNIAPTSRVYRNGGDGTLSSAWNSPSQATQGLAWGDYDNDGDLDLAFGNIGQTNRVYRNDGAGSFASAWNSTETENTLSVAWGDYDNDGDLDLAASNNTQTDRVYRNEGLALASSWNSAQTDDTFGLAWGDYDNDGDLDLAGAMAGATNRVYRNDGSGFASAWNSAETEYSRAVAWADYDADGDLDLAVANDVSAPNRVYANAGGSFASAWSSGGTGNSYGAAWGDYDNDGDPDLAVSALNLSDQVYANAGPGTLTSAWNSAETETGYGVAWGDYDADGRLDLAVANNGQTNRVYRGQDMLPTNAAPSAPTGLVANFSYAADKSTLTFRWSPGDYDSNGVTETVHYAIVAATGPISLAGDNLRVTFPSSNSVAGATFAFSWTQGSPLLGHYLRPKYDGALGLHEVVLATRANTTARPLKLNTTYYFRAQAVDAGLRRGPWSAEFATATLAAPVTNPQVYAVGATSVTLNWKPHPASPREESALGYRLEASTAANFSGTVFLASNTTVGVSTLTATGLAGGTTYYFRVGSLNGSGMPNYLSVGSTLTARPPPAGPAAAGVFNSSITVSFGDSGGAPAGYVVEAATAADFSGSLLRSSGTANPLSLALSPQGLDANTTYYLRAGAIYGAATAYADAAPPSTSTLANAPQDLWVYQHFVTSITVNWKALPGAPLQDSAEGYRLEASTAADFSGTIRLSSNAAVGVSTLTIFGLTGDATYYFRAGSLNWNSVPHYSSTHSYLGLVLAVELSTDTLDTTTLPGPIDLNTEIIISTKVVVTNTGNVAENYRFSATTTTVASPWKIALGASVDRFVLWGVLNSVQPASGNFADEDRLLDSEAECSGGAFAMGGETCVAVPPGQTRTLWLKLRMPVATSTGADQDIKLTASPVRAP